MQDVFPSYNMYISSMMFVSSYITNDLHTWSSRNRSMHLIVHMELFACVMLKTQLLMWKYVTKIFCL